MGQKKSPVISWTELSTPSTFTTISCGNEHCVAIDLNGNLWSWGSNQLGELGIGSFDEDEDDSHNSPQMISPQHFNNEIIVEVSCSIFTICLSSNQFIFYFLTFHSS